MSDIEVRRISEIRTTNKIVPGDGIHGSGVITRLYKTVKPCKKMCKGCYEDFYNYQNAAKGGCWGFSSARVVDKVGYAHIHVSGGPNTIMKKTLSCWHGVRK